MPHMLHALTRSARETPPIHHASRVGRVGRDAIRHHRADGSARTWRAQGLGVAIQNHEGRHVLGREVEKEMDGALKGYGGVERPVSHTACVSGLYLADGTMLLAHAHGRPSSARHSRELLPSAAHNTKADTCLAGPVAVRCGRWADGQEAAG